MTLRVSRAEAAAVLVGHHHLHRFGFGADREGLAALLRRLRCLQLDPLSPMGTSPDMVAIARVQKYKVGDWYKKLLPGAAFEHWAKERCLLPAEAFPYYRDYAPATKWLRLNTHLKRCPPSCIDAVYRQIEADGPLSPSQLMNLGEVEPLDWSGWKGTGKMATMAAEILWTQARIVVVGKNGREKIYDVPQRALSHVYDQAGGDYERWATLQRVEAAGLLFHGSGPHWSTLDRVRTSDLPHQLAEEGLIQEVAIEDGKRRYWAPADLFERPREETDNHMRILGPLDPFLWDRKLIDDVFGFEYIWEVYKPKEKRRWGWYVCPLLHRGKLVGRLEGRVRDGVLVVENLWPENGVRLNKTALKGALSRQAGACGASSYRLP